jgi:hypothetical protein
MMGIGLDGVAEGEKYRAHLQGFYGCWGHGLGVLRSACIECKLKRIIGDLIQARKGDVKKVSSWTCGARHVM